MFSLYFLLLMFVWPSSQKIQKSEGCPDSPGWWNTGTSCYLLSHGKMTWFEAQLYCYEKESYLAEITSQEEDSLLDSLLPADFSYWIGLADFASEGDWVWQDSHKKAEYTDWVPKEPSNNEEEDCVLKSFRLVDGKPGWHDAICSRNVFFGGDEPIHALCEFDIV